MTLTKKDIVESIVEDTSLNDKEAMAYVNAFFDELSSAFENGFDARISGFGNFTLNDKVARPGRNPKTGKECTIEARRVVTLKPGLKLKNTVQYSLENKK